MFSPFVYFQYLALVQPNMQKKKVREEKTEAIIVRLVHEEKKTKGINIKEMEIEERKEEKETWREREGNWGDIG